MNHPILRVSAFIVVLLAARNVLLAQAQSTDEGSYALTRLLHGPVLIDSSSVVALDEVKCPTAANAAAVESCLRDNRLTPIQLDPGTYLAPSWKIPAPWNRPEKGWKGYPWLKYELTLLVEAADWEDGAYTADLGLSPKELEAVGRQIYSSIQYLVITGPVGKTTDVAELPVAIRMARYRVGPERTVLIADVRQDDGCAGIIVVGSLKGDQWHLLWHTKTLTASHLAIQVADLDRDNIPEILVWAVTPSTSQYPLLSIFDLEGHEVSAVRPNRWCFAPELIPDHVCTCPIAAEDISLEWDRSGRALIAATGLLPWSGDEAARKTVFYMLSEGQLKAVLHKR